MENLVTGGTENQFSKDDYVDCVDLDSIIHTKTHRDVQEDILSAESSGLKFSTENFNKTFYRASDYGMKSWYSRLMLNDYSTISMWNITLTNNSKQVRTSKSKKDICLHLKTLIRDRVTCYESKFKLGFLQKDRVSADLPLGFHNIPFELCYRFCPFDTNKFFVPWENIPNTDETVKNNILLRMANYFHLKTKELKGKDISKLQTIYTGIQISLENAIDNIASFLRKKVINRNVLAKFISSIEVLANKPRFGVLLVHSIQ